VRVRRALRAVVLVAAAVGSAGCGKRPSLEIRFIGNAAFELTDGAHTLVVDFPYEPGLTDYTPYDSGAVRARGEVLAVFTHAHRDHLDRGALLARGWPVWGPADALDQLPPERVFPRADSVDFGAFHLVRIPEWHADLEHYAYLIIWRGRRVYHSGDTMDPAHLLAMAELDVALVGEGLVCWIAQQRGTRVPAREVILHHHLRTGPRGCPGARVLAQGESVELQPARL